MQRIDEKGKIFTERVRKGQTDVLITTLTGQIRGFIYITHGQRLKDMLNSDDERFIAVTDAIASEIDGSEVLAAALMAVNKDHIVCVVPVGQE